MDLRRSKQTPWRWPLIIVASVLIGAAYYQWAYSPTRIWNLRPTRDLPLVVVDYSVPFENYREHQSLHWLLNFEKIRAPKGHSEWNKARDYVGYDPTDRRHPRRISSLDANAAEWIAVTDTYGVYRGDLDGIATQSGHMDRSELVFGGLSHEDALFLKRHVDSGKSLYCEFNCFASPTSAATQKLAEKIFGVEWSGWTGHAFLDPSDTKVVPHWFPREFARQFPSRAFPDYPILLLAHQDGRLFVTSAESSERVAPLVRLSSEGRRLLPSLADKPHSYWGWFSLTQSDVAKSSALAYFELPQESEVTRWQKRENLSGDWVAISAHSISPAYYASGDFSNVGFELGDYSRSDALDLKQAASRNDESESNAGFFWNFYVPALRDILLLSPRP